MEPPLQQKETIHGQFFRHLDRNFIWISTTKTSIPNPIFSSEIWTFPVGSRCHHPTAKNNYLRYPSGLCTFIHPGALSDAVSTECSILTDSFQSYDADGTPILKKIQLFPQLGLSPPATWSKPRNNFGTFEWTSSSNNHLQFRAETEMSWERAKSNIGIGKASLQKEVNLSSCTKEKRLRSLLQQK